MTRKATWGEARLAVPGPSWARAAAIAGALGSRVMAVRILTLVGVTGRASITGAMTMGRAGLTAGGTGTTGTPGTTGGTTTGVTTSTRGIWVVVIRTRPAVVGAAEKA